MLARYVSRMFIKVDIQIFFKPIVIFPKITDLPLYQDINQSWYSNIGNPIVPVTVIVILVP
jgi:hypothetical protein